MTTEVVHCKREPFDIYIGRPGRWGNPFVLRHESERVEVLRRYHAWIRTQPRLMAEVKTLKDKRLGCWCAPRLCHGNVLAMLAEEVA